MYGHVIEICHMLLCSYMPVKHKTHKKRQLKKYLVTLKWIRSSSLGFVCFLAPLICFIVRMPLRGSRDSLTFWGRSDFTLKIYQMCAGVTDCNTPEFIYQTCLKPASKLKIRFHGTGQRSFCNEKGALMTYFTYI